MSLMLYVSYQFQTHVYILIHELLINVICYQLSCYHVYILTDHAVYGVCGQKVSCCDPVRQILICRGV